MPAGTVPNLSAVAGVGNEDMASLWASYAMGFKKTPPPASSVTPSRSDRDRESSPPGGEGTGSAHDETSSSGNKEDEDDDDIDADEGLDPRHHDPERLKAFNVSIFAIPLRVIVKFVISNFRKNTSKYRDIENSKNTRTTISDNYYSHYPIRIWRIKMHNGN